MPQLFCLKNPPQEAGTNYELKGHLGNTPETKKSQELTQQL